MQITNCSMDSQSDFISPFIIYVITSVQNNIFESLFVISHGLRYDNKLMGTIDLSDVDVNLHKSCLIKTMFFENEGIFFQIGGSFLLVVHRYHL